MKLRSSSKRQNEKTAMQTARRRVAGDGGTVPGVHRGPPGAWTWSCRCPRQALPTDTDKAPGRACPSPSGDQGNPARGQRALWPSFSPPPRPPRPVATTSHRHTLPQGAAHPPPAGSRQPGSHTPRLAGPRAEGVPTFQSPPRGTDGQTAPSALRALPRVPVRGGGKAPNYF